MDDVLDIWNRIAGWWDGQIGDGNEFQKRLINPVTLELLDLKPGTRLIEIACGNGNFSRVLGRLGMDVLATDGSAKFLELARKRTTPADGKIEYQLLDATNEGHFAALARDSFGAGVCNMAMMDLPEIDALLVEIGRVIRPGGHFVFSVPHPCFNSSEPRMTAELVNVGGKPQQRFGVEISKYRTPYALRSVGILNQPEPHRLFHRSISTLLGACFKAGWVVDGLAEPVFEGSDGGNAFSWKKRADIPPAMVVRLRVLS